MMGRLHRTHQFPYDKKLRKKKKFKKGFKLEEPLLERTKLEAALEKAERSQEESNRVNFVSEVQMDQLCRGKQLRVSVITEKQRKNSNNKNSRRSTYV